MLQFFKKIFSRPVILLLAIYVITLIILNHYGIFSAYKQSELIHAVNQYQVELSGKIITDPIIKSNYQQFVLETESINNRQIQKEKVLVSAPLSYNFKYGDIIAAIGKLISSPKPTFPSNFDYALYLSRQNIYTIFYLSDTGILDNKPNPVKNFTIFAKKHISKKFEQFFQQPYSAILQAMLIGDKVSLESETKDKFINTGLIHLLVVSGLHIGFCVIIFIFFFKLFNLPLKYVYLLTIPSVFFYVLITGANPPAVRAAIMASCILIALILNREPLIYNAIALSALIILFINPQDLFNASFQMSFLATLGIVYLYPKINNIFCNIKSKILKNLWSVVAVTISAQIALIPVLLFYFGKLSIISLITNILIVPIIGFIVGLCYIFYLVTFISNYLAVFFSFLLTHILTIILMIIDFFSNLKYATIETVKPDIFEIIIYYVALILMVEFGKNKKTWVLLLVLISVVIWKPFKQNEWTKTFESKRNITTHIKTKDENTIIFREKIKDKYYFTNLQQYLISIGVKKIDHFYSNTKEDIKENLPKIEIREIVLDTSN